MLTEVGKFLRILRVNNGETAKIMASKLGTSVSYLSAVELGKRNFPEKWAKVIINTYSLSTEYKDKLNLLVNKYCKINKIDLSQIDDKKVFLIKYIVDSDIDDATIRKVNKLLRKKDNVNE